MYLLPRHTQTPVVWVFDALDHRIIGSVPIHRVDLATVDRVARVCCAAKSEGLRPTLRGATPAFFALLDLAGLVGAIDASVVQASSRNSGGNPNSANHSGPPM